MTDDTIEKNNEKASWEANYRIGTSYFASVIEKCVGHIDYESKNVLDVGCWWGWFLRYVRDQGGMLMALILI